MKHIYRFGAGKAGGHGGMKDLLGGKGAGLAEMTRSGVPVPAGFTVTTEVCRYYLKRVQSSVVRVQSTKLLPPGFSKEFDQAVQSS